MGRAPNYAAHNKVTGSVYYLEEYFVCMFLTIKMIGSCMLFKFITNSKKLYITIKNDICHFLPKGIYHRETGFMELKKVFLRYVLSVPCMDRDSSLFTGDVHDHWGTLG